MRRFAIHEPAGKAIGNASSFLTGAATSAVAARLAAAAVPLAEPRQQPWNQHPRGARGPESLTLPFLEAQTEGGGVLKPS